MTSLREFFQACVWPAQTAEQEEFSSMGIAWAEIAISVAIIHGCWLPVRRRDSDEVDWLHQPQTVEQAHALGITLGEQARVVQQMTAQFQSLIPQAVAPSLKGGKTRSLMIYGSGIRMAGLATRPRFPHQDQVVDILHRNFPAGTTNLSFLPSLPTGIVYESWPDDSEVTQQPLPARLFRTHQAQLQVRHLRRG
eukprot:Skav204216  [mRNA]  locus=scaffold1606:200538:201119:- [translate_table: standard]